MEGESTTINIWYIDPSLFLLHGDLCFDAADLEDTASSLKGVLQWFPTGKRIYDPCLAIASWTLAQQGSSASRKVQVPLQLKMKSKNLGFYQNV